MKKLIYIFLLFAFSCDGVEGVDEPPYVIIPIDDITVFENADPIVLDLRNTFTDDDNDDSQIRVRLNDNNNPSLVDASMDTVNRRLTLTFLQDQTGQAIVKVEAESNERTVIEAFLVTVNEIPITVANPIADVTVNEGDPNTTIDLSDVFASSNTAGITKTVQSNSNSNLLTASISGNTLTLAYTAGVTGSTEVTIRGEFNGNTITDAFTVTVNQNPTDEKNDEGITNYANGNYEAAEASFLEAIALGDSRFIELAYVGLGYSQLAQGSVAKHEQALASFYNGYDLDNDEYHNDFMAGIAFLEHRLNQDHETAISFAIAVLDADPAWAMEFNSNINFRDVRLTLATAYYDNQEFSESLFQVKILDPEFELSESDENFLTLLANKLRELAVEFRE